MVTTGEDFRIRMEDMRQNSVEADIAAWQYVNEIVCVFWSGVI